MSRSSTAVARATGVLGRNFFDDLISFIGSAVFAKGFRYIVFTWFVRERGRINIARATNELRFRIKLFRRAFPAYTLRPTTARVAELSLSYGSGG